MDNILGSLNLATHTPNVHLNFGNQVSPITSEDSDTTLTTTFNVGDVEFTEMQMEKIMAEEKLMEIARTDPKRLKRILCNRQSALRSKVRKMRNITELEHKVEALQSQSTTLYSELMFLQYDNNEITKHMNELKHRMQSMEQRELIQDAMQEKMDTELQHLRPPTSK